MNFRLRLRKEKALAPDLHKIRLRAPTPTLQKLWLWLHLRSFQKFGSALAPAPELFPTLLISYAIHLDLLPFLRRILSFFDFPGISKIIHNCQIHNSAPMSVILPCWIKVWLVCSTLICSIDVAFTTLRPESLRGGKYGNYFFLWHIYADVDIRYGDATDPVTRATGALMCAELVLNLLALFLDLLRSCHGLLAAFTSSALVFWKTTIYLCLFIGANTGQSLGENGRNAGTPLWKELLVFWVPNSVWVFVPLLAIVHLWTIIARRCNSSELFLDHHRQGSRSAKRISKELWALDELGSEEQRRNRRSWFDVDNPGQNSSVGQWLFGKRRKSADGR